MFLQKITMQGFKSFADKVVINFEDSVTGVVGPNGCGKSNISDAIRWVLGEQSVKSMRGSSMTDVIFNGTETRRKVNLAEVTLVFNNEKKALNSEYNEVEITRRLYRDTRESEYLINKVPCRLRDIHDMVLDSGLGRDSLSIISQGSVSFFAEAKPSERRVIFEEAAGVAKYKKRKIESIGKLQRTQENVDRLQDIVDEIAKQVSPLKRAAKKALIYQDKKEALQAIEVSVLCQDVMELNDKIADNQKALLELESEAARLETSVGVYDNELDHKRQEVFLLDQDIVKSQEQMMKYVHDISHLETRKIEIEERRKYTLEVGDKAARTQETHALLMDAKLEYEERLARKGELSAEVEFLIESTYEKNRRLADLRQQVGTASHALNQARNRLEFLTHRLNRPFENQSGIQAIMDNKASLFGIHDAISNVFEAQDDYEIAISTALAGSLFHIVATDDKACINAIDFLKRNQSGRATFIPLNVLKPRSVHQDGLVISNSVSGYLGVASEFVRCAPLYDVLKESLLGNVLIVETIESANQLAKRLNHSYKIVTLSGDVIHRGGNMSGGKSKDSSASMLAIRKDKEKLEIAIVQQDRDTRQLNDELGHVEADIRQANDDLMQKRIALAQLEPLLDVKQAKYERLQHSYDELNVDGDERKDVQDDVIKQLNHIYIMRDELTSKLSLNREKRLSLAHEIQRKEVLIRQYRQDLNQITQKQSRFEIELAKQKTSVDYALERLSTEYKMTYEYAVETMKGQTQKLDRDDVLKLRQEIETLGNVNLDAPSEYEEINQRYEFLQEQLSDLTQGRNKLLDIIKDMDEIMVRQFKEMFDKINGELSEIFATLFGGGKARLILEDDSDLLNTGVDIDVQPPGKSVQNIRLFSGGEKSLIAISVLFAILKARHVPLCVFDEVEAALDQGNVERFSTYLKNFSSDTQFIVITHRPGTMSKCETLYGVTMPTRGVSAMIKVRLEEAIELKEVENGIV